MNKDKWFDVLVVVLIMVFCLAVWWPSQYFPCFWDCTYAYNTSLDIYHANFTNFTSNQAGYAHPTLFNTYLAIFWKLTTVNNYYSHLAMFGFLPLWLIGGYWLFKLKADRMIAFTALTVMATIPVVLAEYVNIYVDLPMASLCILGLYGWEKKKYGWWAIFFVLAILIKLPALILMVYFVTSAWKRKSIKMIIISAGLPIVTVVLWLVYHYVETGWWLVDPRLKANIGNNLSNFVSNFYGVGKYLLIGQGRWSWLGLMLLGIFRIYDNKLNIQKIQAFIYQYLEYILQIISGVAFFVIAGEYGQRYGIFILPVYLVLVVNVMQSWWEKSTKSAVWILGGLILIVLCQICYWNPKEVALTNYRFMAPDNLSIMDYVYAFRWLSFKVLTLANEKTVFYGGFPENVALTLPVMGYIDKKIPFITCDKFNYDSSKIQYVIAHPFSPTQYPCQNIIKSHEVTVVDRIERNGKWVELYQLLTASNSASLDKL